MLPNYVQGEQLNEIPGNRRHTVDIDFSKSLCEKSVSSLMHHNIQLSALQAALQQEQLEDLNCPEPNETDIILLARFDTIRRAAIKIHADLCKTSSPVHRKSHVVKLALDTEVRGEFVRLSFIMLSKVTHKTSKIDELPTWAHLQAVVPGDGISRLSPSVNSLCGSITTNHASHPSKGLYKTRGQHPIRSNISKPIAQFKNLKAHRRKKSELLSVPRLMSILHMAFPNEKWCSTEATSMTCLEKNINSEAPVNYSWKMELGHSSVDTRTGSETIDYATKVAIYKSCGRPTKMRSVSLEDILRNSSQNISVEFQLGVAHRLAIAVLQYHSTPWLDSEWGIQDVCFFNAPDLSADDALETLYLEVKSRLCDAEKRQFVENTVEEKDGNGRIPISNMTIFRLGVALLELAYLTPFRWLREREDTGDLIAAQRLSSRMPPLGPTYQQIVQRCLKWALRRNDGLPQARLQWAIYSDVVSPLENMLRCLKIENKTLDTGVRVLVEGDEAVNAE